MKGRSGRANSRNIEGSRNARKGPANTDPDVHNISLSDQVVKHYTSAQVIADMDHFETDPDAGARVPSDDAPEEEEEDEDMKEVINIL